MEERTAELAKANEYLAHTNKELEDFTMQPRMTCRSLYARCRPFVRFCCNGTRIN